MVRVMSPVSGSILHRSAFLIAAVLVIGGLVVDKHDMSGPKRPPSSARKIAR